jgi:hypothetical protein
MYAVMNKAPMSMSLVPTANDMTLAQSVFVPVTFWYALPDSHCMPSYQVAVLHSILRVAEGYYMAAQVLYSTRVTEGS